jgi:hypothetical protein
LDPNVLESNFHRQIVDKWGVSEEEPKKIHKGDILEKGKVKFQIFFIRAFSDFWASEKKVANQPPAIAKRVKVLFACPYFLISELHPEFSNIIFSSLSSSLPFSSFFPFPFPPPQTPRTHMISWKNKDYMTGHFFHFKGFVSREYFLEGP